jgi:hypothetical protein
LSRHAALASFHYAVQVDWALGNNRRQGRIYRLTDPFSVSGQKTIRPLSRKTLSLLSRVIARSPPRIPQAGIRGAMAQAACEDSTCWHDERFAAGGRRARPGLAVKGRDTRAPAVDPPGRFSAMAAPAVVALHPATAPSSRRAQRSMPTPGRHRSSG